MENKKDLSKIRHVALDMDGTIYSGKTLFDCTKPFLALLDELKISYTFLTNNPSKSVEDYLAHLRSFGISAQPEQLYTSTQSTIEFLQQNFPQAKRLFTLGTPSMCREFEKNHFAMCEENHLDEPDAVVVGFDLNLTYARLCRAAYWIKKGKLFIATNPDRVCPTDQPTVLVDCGSICVCLAEATGRKPDAVMGKPDPRMLAGILQRHALQPHELAMIGDRTYTDMAMAHRAKAIGVLVLTGETTPKEAAEFSPSPDFILPSLKEFGDELSSAKQQPVSV